MKHLRPSWGPILQVGGRFPSHNHIARATSWTDPQHTDPLEPGKALIKSSSTLPNDLVDTLGWMTQLCKDSCNKPCISGSYHSPTRILWNVTGGFVVTQVLLNLSLRQFDLYVDLKVLLLGSTQIVILLMVQKSCTTTWDGVQNPCK